MLESVLIKNYKATSLKRDSNTGIRTAASIKCYFDTINLKQSYFCTTYSFKILVSERNIKIISKIVNLKKKKKWQSSYTVYDIYVVFYHEMPWFYQDLKSKNLYFLNLYSVHAARILHLSLDHFKSSQMRKPLQL